VRPIGVRAALNRGNFVTLGSKIRGTVTNRLKLAGATGVISLPTGSGTMLTPLRQQLLSQATKLRDEARLLRQTACGLSLLIDRELFERQARDLDSRASQVEAEAARAGQLLPVR